MGEEATALTLQAAREVRKAWERFVTGEDTSLEHVRPIIRASWQRSRHLGVNPAIRKLPTTLGPEELNRRCQQTSHLVQAGREVFAFLSQLFLADAFSVAVTDSEGNLLYTDVPPRFDKREEINSVPGAGAQESSIGTNAVAMALHLNQPFQMYWHEHYAEIAHNAGGDFSEPYESFLIFPQKEKTAGSTIIPISKEGQRAGLVVIASGLSRARSRTVTKPSWQSTHTFHDLIGSSPAFRHALELAENAARHDWPVLLVGESGTGKELFAQAIHHSSRRASGPFVALNLSTIPKELIASELFGYEEGAFSGALRGGKRGKVELAQGGTLFLDELGDMPAEIQASLLRFLEEGTVVPLGSERPRRVDVRVMTAMNIDPAQAIEQGRLRLDLFHRLNVFPILLPPLRERIEDLPSLARYLLDKEDFSETAVSPEVIELFRQYAWPGNIRELRNVVVRAAVYSSNRIITRDVLPAELLSSKPLVFLPPASSRRVGREQLQHALQECDGNITRAAKLLQIDRGTVYRKLRHYGLTRDSLATESLGTEGVALSEEL